MTLANDEPCEIRHEFVVSVDYERVNTQLILTEQDEVEKDEEESEQELLRFETRQINWQRCNSNIEKSLLNDTYPQ